MHVFIGLDIYIYIYIGHSELENCLSFIVEEIMTLLPISYSSNSYCISLMGN